MKNLQNAQVVFRRVRGRIIPILKKGGRAAEKNAPELAIATLYGGTIGNVVGKVEAAKANKKDGEEITKALRGRKNAVDTKKLTKQSGIKNVNVITNAKDVKKHFKKEDQRLGRILQQIATKGDNAFALPNYKGKDYIFARKKTNKHVIGHELGHIKDFRQNKRGISDKWFSTLSGKTYKREVEAWNQSPVKMTKDGEKLKEKALRTYERNRDYSRAGTAIGTAGVFTLLKTVL